MNNLCSTLLLLILSLGIYGCDTQNESYRNAMRQLFYGDSATAATTLIILAKNGYAPAQSKLGLLYQLGLGVPRNPRLAVYWFHKAATKAT